MAQTRILPLTYRESASRQDPSVSLSPPSASPASPLHSLSTHSTLFPPFPCVSSLLFLVILFYFLNPFSTNIISRIDNMTKRSSIEGADYHPPSIIQTQSTLFFFIEVNPFSSWMHCLIYSAYYLSIL